MEKIKCSICGKRLNKNELEDYYKLSSTYVNNYDKKVYCCDKCFFKFINITELNLED